MLLTTPHTQPPIYPDPPPKYPFLLWRKAKKLPWYNNVCHNQFSSMELMQSNNHVRHCKRQANLLQKYLNKRQKNVITSRGRKAKIWKGIPRLIVAGIQHASHSENIELHITHQKPGANYTGQKLRVLISQQRTEVWWSSHRAVTNHKEEQYSQLSDKGAGRKRICSEM